MRFEKDKRFGDTVKLYIVVYVAFIGIALGLAARNCFGSAPKYLLAVACVACGAYMVVFLLRFIRLLKAWERTSLEMDGDRVRGLTIDTRSFRAEPFEIGLGEVEDVSLRDIHLTRRAPLSALSIRTPDRFYTIIGIENIQAARSKLQPNSDMY